MAESVAMYVSAVAPIPVSKNVWIVLRAVYNHFAMKEFPFSKIEFYRHQLDVTEMTTGGKELVVSLLPNGWFKWQSDSCTHTSFSEEFVLEVERDNNRARTLAKGWKPKISEVVVTLDVSRGPGLAAHLPNMITDNKFEWTYQELPDSLGCGDLVPVYVPQVYTPGWFFIQLESEYKKLAILSTALNAFYRQAEAVRLKINVPRGDMKGMLVAAYYVNEDNELEWHRAMIMRVASPTHVNLRYIDYGTQEANVELSNCRWLHERFGRLPAQAMPATLTGLRPAGGGNSEWSDKACNFFQEWCHDFRAKIITAKLLGLFNCGLEPTNVYAGRVHSLSVCLYLGEPGSQAEGNFNACFLGKPFVEMDPADVTPAGVPRWADPLYGKSKKLLIERKEHEPKHNDDVGDGSQAHNNGLVSTPCPGQELNSEEDNQHQEEGGTLSDADDEAPGSVNEKVFRWMFYSSR